MNQRSLIGYAVLLLVACALPFLVSEYRTFQFTLVLVYSIALLGLNILTGYNGQISLGHGAFYAIGAYVAAILMDKAGFPYWATLPLAGAVCLVAGFLFGLPALRLERDEHHRHKDVYEHSLIVLEQTIDLEDEGPDLVLRLAALLHDIGKPKTRRFEPDGRVSFHHHEVVGAKMTRARSACSSGEQRRSTGSSSLPSTGLWLAKTSALTGSLWLVSAPSVKIHVPT
jgi:putative nucleotidyltransferase with HDIG domain